MRLAARCSLRTLPFAAVGRLLAVCAAAAWLTSCDAFADLLQSVSTMCRQSTFDVTTTDEGVEADMICWNGSRCTLRAALNSAAVCGGNRTIRLAAGATYTLTRPNTPLPSFRTIERQQDERVGPVGLPRIVGNVTILGQDAVIERRSGRSFRFFHVLPGGELTLDGLVLRQGAVPPGGQGGAVYNAGILTARDTRFERNEAPEGLGGAVYNSREATFLSSLFTGNVAGTRGSANHQEDGVLNIETSTLDGNGRTGAAGALSVQRGSVRIERSTLSSNLGGVAGIDAAGGHLTVQRSTFHGQQGDTDGALSCYGDRLSSTVVHFNDVTIAGNAAARVGAGGVRARGDCRIVFSNSIVAANRTAGELSDCARRGETSGSNLDSDGSCGFSVTADPPRLHALAPDPLAPDGELATMVPRRNSPAVDAGSTCLSLDQRGRRRPAGSACDIGAVELPAGSS